MKNFYTIEQIADCLVVSTGTAQIGDKGPGNPLLDVANADRPDVRLWQLRQERRAPMNQQSVRQNQQPAAKRPTEYTKEIGETICGRLVEDENLRSICAEPEMPDVATVSNWISNNAEFRDMYALAREFQAHCIADEVIELADEVSTEWVEKVRANGRVVRGPDRKNLPRYRLRNEVRHWVAEQLLARARQLSARTLFDP
jgi:hypothetical protein